MFGRKKKKSHSSKDITNEKYFDEIFNMLEVYIKVEDPLSLQKKLQEISHLPNLKELLNRTFEKLNLKTEVFNTFTLMDLAFIQGNLEIMQILIKYGAVLGKGYYSRNYDGNFFDIDKEVKYNFELIKYIYSQGYQFDGEYDSTIRYLVEHIRNPDEIDFFISNGISINKMYYYYMSENTFYSKDIINYFINNQANSNYFPEYEYTHSIYYAVENKEYEIAKLLIENGADINLIYEGYSPLMRACTNHKEEAVEFLLNYQPDLTLRNSSLDSLIFITIFNKDSFIRDRDNEDKIIRIIDMLYKAGVDVFEKNNERIDAKQYAIQNGLQKVAKHIESLMETASTNKAENNSNESPITPETDNEKTPVQSTNTANNFVQVAEELKSLKELLDLGVINEEEFNKKKTQLLGL